MNKKKIRVVLNLLKEHNEFLDEDKTYYLPELEKDLTKYQIVPEVGETLSIDGYEKYKDYWTGELEGPFPIGGSVIVSDRSYTPQIGAIDLIVVPRYQYEEES
jgi:hypothetical protein